MNKHDVLEKELSRLLEWIRAADTRGSLILPLATAMLGALAALAPAPKCWTEVAMAATGICVLFHVGSIVFVGLASFPRTNGPEGSLIFFGSIAKQDINSYRNAIFDLDEQRYLNDLIDQCHVNAVIASAKYRWTKRSMACLFIASPFWVASVYFLYGIKEV